MGLDLDVFTLNNSRQISLLLFIIWPLLWNSVSKPALIFIFQVWSDRTAEICWNWAGYGYYHLEQEPCSQCALWMDYALLEDLTWKPDKTQTFFGNIFIPLLFSNNKSSYFEKCKENLDFHKHVFSQEQRSWMWECWIMGSWCPPPPIISVLHPRLWNLKGMLFVCTFLKHVCVVWMFVVTGLVPKPKTIKTLTL